MGRVWLALVAAGLIAIGILSIRHAARRDAGRSMPLHRAYRSRAVPPMPVIGQTAAPAIGTTGTTALPAPPFPASFDGDRTVVAAVPFSTAHASNVDRGRALQCLTAAIYFEAGSEPDAGQQAVAQVVLNRVRHPAFPPTVCGVVYQGSERSGCQFSFACDGATARIPSPAGWARAAGVAAMALSGRVFARVGLATHYHTYAVTPAWSRALVMTGAVGAHFFHRWRGYWGTAAAFRQSYRGGEPLPVPHVPLTVPPSIFTAASPTVVPPVLADSRAPQRAVAPDTLPPPSQILDRWKDSGKPLR